MKITARTKIRLLPWFMVAIFISESLLILLGESPPLEYSINRNLVSPAWVHKLIKYHEKGSTSAAPMDYDYHRNRPYLIFETSWGPLTEANHYLAGHIPGAVHSNSDIYENGEPRWFLRSDLELFETMQSMGITADTAIIVYGHKPIFATRLWWILKYAGLKEVRILDGGFEKWISDGFEAETTVHLPKPAPVEYAGPVRTEFIASVEYVADHYKDTDRYLLADVRDQREYEGRSSGYNYLIEKGRIPNAIWCYPVGGANDRYFHSDNTFRTLEEIRAIWEKLDLIETTRSRVLKKEIIFYCGGGYRSSSAFFYAYLMGYKNIRNFSDGWQGWSTTYTYDLSEDCGEGIHGTKSPAVKSKYCQRPSGREIAP